MFQIKLIQFIISALLHSKYNLPPELPQENTLQHTNTSKTWKVKALPKNQQQANQSLKGLTFTVATLWNSQFRPPETASFERLNLAIPFQNLTFSTTFYWQFQNSISHRTWQFQFWNHSYQSETNNIENKHVEEWPNWVLCPFMRYSTSEFPHFIIFFHLPFR